MLVAMVVLAIAGLALLITAPVLAKAVVGRERDPMAITRVLQILAVALLVGALFARPYNPETAAVPPSPNAQTPR